MAHFVKSLSRINKLLSENEGGQHCEDKTNTFTLSHGESHQQSSFLYKIELRMSAS